MSKLRPTLHSSNQPCYMSTESAYSRVLQAVSRRRGLLHGKLEDNAGNFCAIGCTFDDGVKALPTSVIDEIAAYNDSFPKLTREQRWRKVVAWLRFRTAMMKAKK